MSSRHPSVHTSRRFEDSVHVALNGYATGEAGLAEALLIFSSPDVPQLLCSDVDGSLLSTTTTLHTYPRAFDVPSRQDTRRIYRLQFTLLWDEGLYGNIERQAPCIRRVTGLPNPPSLKSASDDAAGSVARQAHGSLLGRIGRVS